MKLLFYCCVFVTFFIVIHRTVTRVQNVKLETELMYHNMSLRDTCKIDFPPIILHMWRREIVIGDLNDRIVVQLKQIPFFNINNVAAIRLCFCPWDSDAAMAEHIHLVPGEVQCVRIRLYAIKILYYSNRVETYDVNKRHDIVAFERPYVLTDCYITDTRIKGDKQDVVECK